jgi:aconitate hydratase A / 2-methylisocitrate dehydratase
MRETRRPDAARRLCYYSLYALEEKGSIRIDSLPFTIRVLLENLLRNLGRGRFGEEDVLRLARWRPHQDPQEIAFMPSRVLLQDFTGVPAVVDLAAMRSAARRLGGDPSRINPVVPADLVIDHSVQVDSFGSATAFSTNVALEYERNRERYTLLKWAQGAFHGFRVVPPAQGICHQVNLEFLASVVHFQEQGDDWLAYPDTLVGTDSHTTMVNGLGVLGWGVGGIEAEAVMLGQPYYMLVPEVVGMRLSGRLPARATATDLVLTVTEILRKKGVVGKFVEFFGPGIGSLALPDRATVSNMSPEYGATAAYFPVDGETLSYLGMTGRKKDHIDLVERYCREQGLFHNPEAPEPQYSDVVELNMDAVEPSVAGPRRPQDRIPLAKVKEQFVADLEKKYGKESAAGCRESEKRLLDGAVVIAAITSCTNTSNPSVMIGAGLLARKAVARGLTVPPHVKTSLAPGSRVVVDYLVKAGLMEPLEALGFHVVGFGCTTCIGNSGPLPEPVRTVVEEQNLVVAAVLSGNRNFEARIHGQVRANYLASPILVVAYALAGRVDLDITEEPLGFDPQGKPVHLRELWPEPEEIQAVVGKSIASKMFTDRYARIDQGDKNWQDLSVLKGGSYQWDPGSTYIQEPPFFAEIRLADPPSPKDIEGARVLVMVGDSVTTDHISPAGSIPEDSPAGRYLIDRGIRPVDFNSYGSRRGNHNVMVRGTFANIRLRNLLVPDREGAWTLYLPGGELLSVFEASTRYQRAGVPLVVLAGKEYGTGSSRDWAAKGTHLLGVRAVLAESFERIHRSNLVGMGVLPLQFLPGQNVRSLGITGRELFSISGLSRDLAPGKELNVLARSDEGKETAFPATARLDSPVEIEYYRNGGILQKVLRDLLRSEAG